jgi:RNA polymerase sigma factor (sigma-70 family)
MRDLNIQKIKEGDEVALRELFNELYPLLLQITRRTFRGLNHCDQEDIVAEALVTIYKNIDKAPTESQEGFIGWCKVMTRNISKRMWKETAMRRLRWTQLGEEAAIIPDRTPSSQDLEDSMNLMLNNLPELQQTVLRLSLCGLSVDEIASTLDRPRGTIFRSLNLAKLTLEKLLSSTQNENE